MAGIKLNHGGTYDNTGTITGTTYGIEIYGGVGTVVNSGSITASSGSGVILMNGGSVTNKTGGTISGSSGAGVQLRDGGSVTNAVGASIQGYEGVAITGAVGTVTNAGAIKSQGYGYPAVSLGNGGSVTNSGTITGAVFIFGSVAGSITNSGTINGDIGFGGSGANTLTLQTGSVIDGSVTGSTASGATNTLALTGSGALSGAVSNFNTLSVKASGTWTLRGGTFGATTVSTGTLAIAGGLTTAMTEAAAATVTIGSGDGLTLNGASSLSGTIAGLGTLLLDAGTTTFAGSAKLAVSYWSIEAAGSATVSKSITYSGAFTDDSSGILTLSGGGLILSGAATFEGATIAGSQGVTDSGSTNVFGLTVENTAGFTDQAFLTQDGEVTLGDAKGDKSLIAIAKTGTWDIVGDTGINLGSSKALPISNSGLFEKTSGLNVSAIAPAFVNNGEVLDTSGTLDFQGAVTGTGTDVIASVTAILEFDSTVAKTQTIDFLRPDGVLFLGSPTGFSGVLNGFDTIFTNDAVELLGSWSIKGYTQTTAAEGTLTLSSGAQSAAIAFDGSYGKSGFHAFAFGGETIVTYL